MSHTFNDEPSARPEPTPIVAWPDWSAANPYQRLFYDALEPLGFSWMRDVPLSFRELRATTPVPAVLHLHWPYAFWRSRGSSSIRQWRALTRFAVGLNRERARGATVVWTVHDLQHLGGDRPVDVRGRRMVYRASDLVIHHTDWSRGELRERWGAPRGTEIVMPHGNYDGALPAPSDRAATRAAWGLPDGPVFLSFGRLDGYKGFDMLPEVARTLAGRAHFMIAGPSGSLEGELDETSRHLTVHEGRLSDQELADLLDACDGVVLPYRTITTSGALLAALSAGRGVVTSDLAPFRELLTSSGAAVLVPPTVEGLVAGVGAYLSGSTAERGRAARKLADRWAWAGLVAPVADELRRIMARKLSSSA